MANGFIERGLIKLLIGPIVRWVMSKMLKWGWIYPAEVKDISARMEAFGRGMVDAEAGIKPKLDTDSGSRRDRFRGRTISVILKPNARKTVQDKVPEAAKPPGEKPRPRFRSRRGGAFRR